MYVRLRPPAELDHLQRDGLTWDFGFCGNSELGDGDPNDVPPWDCQGRSEIELIHGKTHVFICRKCAADLADSIRGCVELLDAKTAQEWLA